ncbi:MAG: VOC family protein [Steroidobacteraceae bacterium]
MSAYSTPRIAPYLLYEDLPGAWQWLERAFGFRVRHPVPAGVVTHVEMVVEDDGVVMMGCPGAGYRNPKHLGYCTQNLYVRVTSLDRHFERAVAAGAVVLEKPADQPYGDRRYAVEDPEGHRWYFAQSLGE